MQELSSVDEQLDAGDIPGAIRGLSDLADRAPLVELAARLDRAAAACGFEDLVAATSAVRAQPDDPAALYDLGFACIERGVLPLAVRALAEADQRAPRQRPILLELAVAYQRSERYADAVALLAAHDADLVDWPDRYLAGLNAVQAGDLDTARRYRAALSTPDDEWTFAASRLGGMLDRAELVPGPLDRRDLRGWHFVLDGSILGSISPYGLDEGMNGRYAFTQDAHTGCRRTLGRLATALRVAGIGPTTVSLLPDRSSRILGLAAATLLDRPAAPFDPDRTDTVIVAYDLREVERDIAITLRDRPRAPGSVLVEHATCWTTPPPVAADLSGLLHQVVIEPWGERVIPEPPRTGPARSGPDERPEIEIAGDVVAAEPDAGTPAPGDTDDDFAAFVAAVAGRWPAPGRDSVFSPGPVTSSRFV